MRVAMLMNFIAPYRVPFYEGVRDRVSEFRFFLSTAMESDRSWVAEWGTLDVEVQRNLTFKRPYRDPFGFRRQLLIHVPYDTMQRLWRFRPDAVISVELGPRSIQAALFKLLRPRTTLLIWCMLSEHSERGWGRARRVVRGWILARADAVLVNGESGARYVRQFGVPDPQIHRVNQPVDIARFAAVPRSRPETEVSRLLCVGTLTGRKGVLPFAERLAKWARQHPARSLEMWWLGSGDQHAALAALALPDNLRQVFCGDLPYAEVPQVYAQCDLLVFPTLLDEWGLVVNEAMAAGLPVLGSIYSQAVEELVVEGNTGWVFDAVDAASADAALDRALGVAPERLVAMRAAARQRIATLTPETAARKVVEALHQASATERRNRPGSVPARPEAC